ncbi:hypothetical protein COLO4_34362 [Corchorus olitorius]|uniref:Uncharacterized protein n=1 Tax=Corchorus olitorius TaxID=93759 RepID=A0A1R3GL67_9ROSI|nr:hypothetical protein COLO4_34362 [Corchorus olitorius]
MDGVWRDDEVAIICESSRDFFFFSERDLPLKVGSLNPVGR